MNKEKHVVEVDSITRKELDYLYSNCRMSSDVSEAFSDLVHEKYFDDQMNKCEKELEKINKRKQEIEKKIHSLNNENSNYLVDKWMKLPKEQREMVENTPTLPGGDVPDYIPSEIDE